MPHFLLLCNHVNLNLKLITARVYGIQTKKNALEIEQTCFKLIIKAIKKGKFNLKFYIWAALAADVCCLLTNTELCFGQLTLLGARRVETRALMKSDIFECLNTQTTPKQE